MFLLHQLRISLNMHAKNGIVIAGPLLNAFLLTLLKW